MANPWIEHVKQKAKELNVSYGCAITLPEVRKTYKPLAKPSKPTKPQRKTEQKRMTMEDVDAPPAKSKPKAKPPAKSKPKAKPNKSTKPHKKTEQKRMAMEDVNAQPAKSKRVLQMYDSDDSLIKFDDFPEEQADRRPSSTRSVASSRDSWLTYFSEDAFDPQKQATMTESQIEASTQRAYRRRYPEDFGELEAEEEGQGDGFLQQPTDTDTKPIGSSSNAL